MLMRHCLQVLLLALAAVAVTGCDHSQFDAGPTRSETRNVGSFDAIDLDGSARLLVTVGGRRAVSLDGPDAVLSHITTEIHGDTLRIRTRAKEWVWANGQPRVTVNITVPKLESLRLQGGNDVRLTGYGGGESRIEVRGAAHVRASGQLDRLEVDMQGAGFADLSELVATEAEVKVDGVGRVVVHPRERLDATMNGIGAILYAGSPHEVNTHMNGLGSISRYQEDRAERQQRRKDERRQRHDDRDEPDDTMAAPDEPIEKSRPDLETTPDDLQPELDNRPKKIVDMRKVI